jgi:hypothetical protein
VTTIVNLNVTPLFATVEHAVDTHASLIRMPGNEASLTVSRYGWTMTVRVSLRGSRKKATPIHGDGDTAAEAAANLIHRLDIWAQAIA